MKIVTSESVTEGHPDKLCDQISDSILDAYLKEDPEAHVAIECMISKNLLLIAGEVKSSVKIQVEPIARNILMNVGYTSNEIGIDAQKCIVLTNVNQQSTDIDLGVAKASGEVGAGDQGSMYGYACSETDAYLPLSIYLAHSLVKKLDELRHSQAIPFLLPDGKAQVSVAYDEFDKPIKITDIVLSAQHTEETPIEKVREVLLEKVIRTTVDASLIDSTTRFLINPTGRFVIGGPLGDTGLTGRKIVVDTYGGVIPHGGGAFSGKDCTKVDRSASYMARYIAKNIVAAGLAQRCQVCLSYAIGYSSPVALDIDTFGTESVSSDLLKILVLKIFDLSPKGIIEMLSLNTPVFKQTSVYGHFNSNTNFSWEKIDQVKSLIYQMKRIEHNKL